MMSVALRRGCAALVLACSALAFSASAYELVNNSSFETNGGAGSGTFASWSTFDQAGSQGGFKVQTGTTAPLTPFTVPPPPGGSFTAMSDQPGPGGHVLYQDVAIPAGVTANLSARIFVLNETAEFSTPASLDYTVVPNQQARFDIVSPASPIQDTAGVLQNLYKTQVGDAPMAAYTTINANVSAYAGQTIRLRFAESDNIQGLNFGVDLVSITVPGLGTSSTALVSSVNPSIIGSAVTFTATITVPGPVPATGSVTFFSDNTAIPGCVAVVPVANVAQCTTSTLALGTHAIRADYTGDSNYTPSSGSLTQNVIPVPTAPGPPTGVTATGLDHAIRVDFTPPANNGGSNILFYTVTCTPVGGGTPVTATGTSSPIFVTGLTNGVSYTCTVSATNAIGTSSATAAAAPATPVFIAVTVPALGQSGLLGLIALLALAGWMALRRRREGR
jgi:Bacterial Ig-like domain (group 3)/Fibronectin type III domain